MLRGELHCGIDGLETVAKAGTLIHVPGGSTHWFRFGAGGGELLVMTSRGNASAMFTDYGQASLQDHTQCREELVKLMLNA